MQDFLLVAVAVLLALLIVGVPLSWRFVAARTRRKLALAVAFDEYDKAIETPRKAFERQADFYAKLANLTVYRVQAAQADLAITREFPDRFSDEEVSHRERLVRDAQSEHDHAHELYKEQRQRALATFLEAAKPALDALPERVRRVERLRIASAWWYDAPGLALLERLTD